MEDEAFDHDVFIAHADEDIGAARELRSFLHEQDPELRVFCPAIDLRPGELRDQETKSALLRARMVVALVSRHSAQSYGFAEASQRAIERISRDDRCRIVPVFLEPVDTPYGMHRLVPLLRDDVAGLASIAYRLVQTLAEMQGRPRSRPYGSAEREDDRLRLLLARRHLRRQTDEDTHELDEEIGRVKGEIRRGGVIRSRDFLGNRYELIELIGTGGFASVFKATDHEQQRVVAIKVLHGRIAEDRSQRDRFERGIGIMQRLVDAGVEGVARVLQPVSEDEGYYYCVLEYLAGFDLRQAVTERRVPPERIIGLVLELGPTLHAAHLSEYIHRDVKPTNILLDQSGRPKLTDFDLVWSLDTSGGTRAGPLGSFIFSSPEALTSGDRVDCRADVYSLAMVTLFGLHGADLPLTVIRHTNDFIRALDCKASVQRVLERALDWDIERRHESVEAFCEDLERAHAQNTTVVTAKTLDQERVRRETFATLFGIEIEPPMIAGRYRLGRRLGRGSSGQVHSAYDTTLQRVVALKLLISPDNLDHITPTMRERLLKEAQLPADLKHPNIVRVFDVDISGNPCFISMELIEGSHAADWIEEMKPAWEEILDVFLQAGEGLAEAHRRGVVHGDFKAQNVLVQVEPWRVCVTDFGLARRHLDGEMSKSDDVDAWGGTPGHMAPETMGKEATPKSDQFSFSAALYKALYGQLPFSVAPDGASLVGALPAPPELQGVPEWILPVLQRGLAASPKARYAGMRELLRALGAHV